MSRTTHKAAVTSLLAFTRRQQKVEKVMSKIIQRILVEDRAASMVEYALLVVLIAIVALVAVSLAGDEVSSMFSEIADDLATT